MSDCDHHHCHDHKPSRSELTERMALAQARIEAAGERMTAPRQRTFEMVLEASGPIKAYELIEKFYEDGPAKPPTVYRSLAFLEQLGLIHRIESLNAYVACSHTDEAHAAGFLLCECCGHSEELSGLSADFWQGAAQAQGFEIKHLTLEVRGLCKACRA